MYRIVFLTDLHLGLPGERPFGLDLRDRFTKIIPAIASQNPDLLVLGGDICNDLGDERIYTYVLEKLKPTLPNFIAIPGNHDDSSKLAKVFGYTLKGQNESYFDRSFDNNRFLFLDTSAGKLSEDQWRWLEDQLNKFHVSAIFMHHPPCKAGVVYMDEHYAFQEPERMAELAIKTKYIIPVICGHYHCSIELLHSNMEIFITPSLGIQIDVNSAEFKVDHERAGFRVLDFEDFRLSKTQNVWF
jgi:3',5'-cyclic-AMP phosphodiesterase